MDRSKPSSSRRIPTPAPSGRAGSKLPTPKPASAAGGSGARPPQTNLGIAGFKAPIKFSLPGMSRSANNSAHAKAVARFQALHSDMYEEVLGEQTFSYHRAKNLCVKLAQENPNETTSEVRAMLFGTIALRVFHDQSKENYKELGRRNVVSALRELLRSDPLGIMKIKMGGTAMRSAWILPATSFSKELAGLISEPSVVPQSCEALSAVLQELEPEATCRQFFLDAARLAINMVRGKLLERPDLVEQLNAVIE